MRAPANSAFPAALLALGSLLACGPAAAVTGLSYRADLLGIGEYYDAADSLLNTPHLAQMSRYNVIAAVRPEIRFQSQRWLLLAQPRAEGSYTHYTDTPVLDQDATHSRGYVHQALVRFNPAEGLYLSGGREVLQWGPSYLVSVSNPFNPDNGRNNPITEVPGLDYARVVWLPSPQWSLAAIANVGRGEIKYAGSYPRQYAFKLDYNGGARYFSLIPSWRESPNAGDPGGDYRLGAYGGWTVSKAWLVYAEGSYRHVMDNYAALAGTAYTFEGGSNVALEYYRNRAGCTLEPYALCFAAGLPATGPIALPSQTRKNYLLLQWLEQNRFKRWDFTARWIAGLDDKSSQLVGIADFAATPSAKLYFVASGFLGAPETEYRSLLDVFVSIGLRYSF